MFFTWYAVFSDSLREEYTTWLLLECEFAFRKMAPNNHKIIELERNDADDLF